MKPRELAFYFGCYSDLGHRLYSTYSGFLRAREEAAQLPWGEAHCESFNDGHGANGQDATITHREGWTVLAFSDRTIDTRPGSKSVFMFKGMHDFPTMVKKAKAAFPTIWERFSFEVALKGNGEEDS